MKKTFSMNIEITITKKIIGFLNLMLCCFFLQAQPNTLVMGKINNAKAKEIELSINKLYLTNNIEVYSSKVIDNNTFAFAVEVDEPQIAIIEYARNKGIIYLEPNDTLYIECDADDFQYSFEFTGGLGDDNTCFTEYLRKYPKEMSVFNMTQYKQKSYWYQNSPKMDELMLRMNRNLFDEHMKIRKSDAFAIMDKYEIDQPNTLTKDFKEFLEADILYDFAYHKMLYGNVFKNRYGLTEKYCDFLNEIPIQNNQIGNQWYRQYLIAYFDYQNSIKPDDRNQFIHQYEEGSKLLEGKTRAYFQSETIARAFRAKENEVIMEKFWDYMRYQDYGAFDEKLLEVHAKAVKFAGGTIAPGFTLSDIEDKEITLASYKGQVVYLNFWASWCRPCMNKMEKIKPIQSELEDQGIVFINVSLDRKEEVWKETLEKKSFKGIHVLASGELNSDIAKAYEIKVLPRYFIINKNGEFVKTPKSNAIDQVRSTLLKVVEQ